MAGLQRYISILRLFTPARSLWTVPQLSDELELPASSLYRIVRELVSSGFLAPANEGHYRLGAAFVEFDRIVRLTDPLVQRGRPLLGDIVSQAKIPCVGLISRLYNNTVMCIADEGSPGISFRSSFERGKPMPLTRGATSKVILAQLPTRKLNRVILDADDMNGHTIDMENLRKSLGEIRKRGFSITYGEIDEGLVGIAAPIMRDHGTNASLSLVVRADDLDEATRQRLIVTVVSAASLLSEASDNTDNN